MFKKCKWIVLPQALKPLLFRVCTDDYIHTCNDTQCVYMVHVYRCVSVHGCVNKCVYAAKVYTNKGRAACFSCIDIQYIHHVSHGVIYTKPFWNVYYMYMCVCGHHILSLQLPPPLHVHTCMYVCMYRLNVCLHIFLHLCYISTCYIYLWSVYIYTWTPCA